MSLLEMRNIHKSFNGVEVLHGVDLTVNSGEVHALLGENGAGKSTLMNVLTGVYPKDEGTVTFNGEAMDHISIARSEAAGIAFVHQELNLFNDLTVTDNIFLGKEYAGSLGKLNIRKERQEAEKLFKRLGISIDPNAIEEDLSSSEKQMLEISKALFMNARLIILDEPTTSLNTEEVEHLFSIIRSLKKDGISFIFISHKMPEIFEIADRYTIFRNGNFIKDGAITDTTPEEVTSLMVGKTLNNGKIYEAREAGDVVLQTEHLTGRGFHDVSLTVKKGQIIGLTGLQGSGADAFLGALFGSVPVHGGTIRVHGEVLHGNSIHKAMKRGIALLPSNRKENSVIPDLSILENMSLAEQTLSAGKMQIHKGQEKKKYEKYKDMLNIKAERAEDPILSLSGGNQQKVFLARWLNTGADLLLFDNPTQGIDVGAKAEIYKLILSLAQSGKTILLNTLEIPELQKVADKCVIFYDGTVIKVLEHDEIEEQRVMLYSTNAVGKGA